MISKYKSEPFETSTPVDEDKRYDIPRWYDVFMIASFYRIGAHGLIYVWKDGQWIRSQMEREDIEKGIKRQKFYPRGNSNETNRS